MHAEVQGGLLPLSRSAISGEVKGSHIMPKNNVDQNERVLSESDRIQVIKQAESTESSLIKYSLTNNPSINQYIEMLNQGFKEDKFMKEGGGNNQHLQNIDMLA